MTKFYFTENQGFTRYTQKYSVCGIKLDTKVINLHKIEVVKISFFSSK